METFTGIEYLQIAIANHAGFDKKTWHERIEWTKTHKDELENIAFNSADEPAEMLGAIQALHKAERGIPIGFPIGLDATCSVLQLMSCLTNDKAAMKCCNVIGTNKREDAYRIVYDRLKEEPEIDKELKRDDVKQAIMTSCYGSNAKPKEIFGEANVEVFENVMSEMFPRVWKLNKIMLQKWNAQTDEYSWVLPDNFHAKVEVFRERSIPFQFNKQVKYLSVKEKGSIPRGRSLGANMIHSVDALVMRELVRRTNYDLCSKERLLTMKQHRVIENENTRMVQLLLELYHQSGFLSQRIVDYIRPYNISFLEPGMKEILYERFAPKPFQMLTIHDCFRVHANYCNEVRRQYVELLAEITESNLLNFLCSQIINYEPKFMKIHGLGDTIRKTSNYALS